MKTMLLNLKHVGSWITILGFGLCIVAASGAQSPSAQQGNGGVPAAGATQAEKELINLSNEKWRWMAERNVDSLDALYDQQAVFVHMGATMTKSQELYVIKSGTIQYKHAEIQDVSVRFIGTTAIVLSKIQLIAVVRGNEVTNPFMVTEVYVKEGGRQKLASMSFTHLISNPDPPLPVQ